MIRDVLGSIASDGLSDAELARGKGQLRGGLVLGLEDPGSRMSRIGKAELNHGEHCTVEEALEQIDEVTPEQVGALARELLRRPIPAAVVGRRPARRDRPIDRMTELIA